MPVEAALRMRLGGLLYAAGATLGTVGLLLTPSPRVDVDGSVVAIAVAYGIAAILYFGRTRIPPWGFHLSLICGTALITWAIELNSETPSIYVVFYLWVALGAAYFLPGLQAAAHIVLIAAAFGAVLLVTPPTDPFLRWVTAMGTIVVASAMVAALRQRVASEAFFDSVTGVPNRALFMNRLEHALAAREPQDACVGLLFLDLDRFKAINDSFGHSGGDKVLAEVAQRIRGSLRPDDTVARLGGDEFTVLLSDISGAPEAAQVAERVASAVSEPMEVGGTRVQTTATFGIAAGRRGRDDADALLQNAGAALHRAKQSRRQMRVYEQRLTDENTEEFELEQELNQALERREFRLHYQPKVALRDLTPRGFEALLRWEHPHRGLLAPAAFLELAEKLGLTVPIGKWVLDEACRQARAWIDEFGGLGSPAVCVNLSDRQLGHPELVDDVLRAVKGAGIEASDLCLEVTETAVMSEASTATDVLSELKRCGVSLAIDDFGTGYSSLARLHSLPLDILKIDQSFTSRLTVASESQDVAKAVVSLGRALDMLVVAEGVETEEQLQCLRALGCDAGQGYYFSPPRPPEEVPLRGMPIGGASVTEGSDNGHTAEHFATAGEPKRP